MSEFEKLGPTQVLYNGRIIDCTNQSYLLEDANWQEVIVDFKNGKAVHFEPAKFQEGHKKPHHQPHHNGPNASRTLPSKDK